MNERARRIGGEKTEIPPAGKKASGGDLSTSNHQIIGKSQDLASAGPPPRPPAKRPSVPPPRKYPALQHLDGLSVDKLKQIAHDQHEQILELLNRDSGTANELIGLREKLNARIFSPAKRPKEPQPRFSLAGVGICTPGNLTTISAQAKAGKTGVVCAGIASTFAAPDSDCLGFTSQNSDGFAVVHLDTEQCPFDHYQGIKRAVHRAGAKAAPEWLHTYCLTDLPSKEIRRAIRFILDEAVRKFGGIHSLILDGVADAVADVNDAAEVNEFVSELHALAIKHNCPIVGVIHLNPGSDFKTRGHLGSQLERKSETNLRLEKDEDGVSVMWADKNRRAPIPKKSAPCFAWDDSRHLHITVENPAEARADAKRELNLATASEAAGHVFAQGKKSALPHGELVQRICDADGLQPSGSRRRVEIWLRDGIVTKDDAGFYHISP